MICHYCGRDLGASICRNTRDMTDRAIGGDETCFGILAAKGFGEAGESYVRANKAARASARLDAWRGLGSAG